jgi:hypothetical protein
VIVCASLHHAPAIMFNSFVLCCCSYNSSCIASTWHHRLGHPGVDTMSKLSNASSVIYSRHTYDLCHACQLGPHQLSVFLGASIIGLSLMITLILCGPFLCALNMTLFPHCQFFLPLFPCSLATPSKPSSVTMVVSSTMPPPMHSLPPVESSCGCPIHTCLHREVKPSVLFAPSIICSALYYFSPLCRLATRSKHSTLLRTC